MTEVGAVPVGLRPLTAAVTAGAVTTPARPIAEIDVEAARARPTGVDELDRVLGGGLVPGAVVLLAGEPGVGKSTLLLDVASALRRAGGTRARRHRRGVGRPGAAAGRAHRRAARPALPGRRDRPGRAARPRRDGRARLLVVDSVQTIASPAADGSAGGVTQVRGVAAALIAVAKARTMATVLVGHGKIFPIQFPAK